MSAPAARYMLEGNAGLAYLVNLVIANVISKSPSESSLAQWIREIKALSMDDEKWSIVYHEAYLRLEQMYQQGGWAK